VKVVRLVLAYDGTGFHGWARQAGLRTVQGTLELVLARVLGEVPRIAVAGRTDAGVHARGQVGSFPTADPDPPRLQRAINRALAPEVVALRVSLAPPGFDARRDATAREYRYRIDVGPVPDPFEARYVWHRPGDVSLARMRRAARFLVGEHDFASFCRAPSPPRNTVRVLRRLAVSRRGDRVDVFAVGDSFCHQMVRSLVGTLEAVGRGSRDPEQVPVMIAARQRATAGLVAPPHGLTLERVRYGPRRGGTD
jgi:tRNA pseudouridine38-40 synthase